MSEHPFLVHVAGVKSINMLNLAIIEGLNMMTPREVIAVTEIVHGPSWRYSGKAPFEEHQKFTEKLREALAQTVRSMYAAGKTQVEPYARTFVTPDIRLYRGSDTPANRTLIVGFPGNGGRLMMPIPIILQHLSADSVDVMLVPDKMHANYRKGIPPLADNVVDAMEPLRALVPASYRRVVTFGTSSGGVPSLVAAAALGADHALAVGAGPPDDERWAEGVKFTKRQMLEAAAPRLGGCHITLAFGAQSPADQVAAEAITKIIPQAGIVPVSVPEVEVKHVALFRLVEARRMRPFLEEHLGLGR